ncbi:MAG: ATP-binding protein [Candidatus Dormibacteraceae bacterium]
MPPSNPFRPGFNQAPPLLAGRDEVLDAADEAMAVIEDGRMPTPLMLQGPRGVGKTVLLTEIARRAAESRGWPRVHLEVRAGGRLTPALLAALSRTQTLLTQVKADRMQLREAVLRAQVMGVGAEVHVAPSASVPLDPDLSLDLSLRALAQAAMEREAGIVLTIDEAQLARREEAGDLAALLQEGVDAGWPIATVVAGLPSMSQSGHFPTYFERAEWYEVGALRADAAELALVEPARSAGRPFAPGAAEVLIARSGGYPYAIQLFGQHAWRAARDSDRIGVDHAEAAVRSGERRLLHLHQERWNALPHRERQYLSTLADLSAGDTPVTGSDVAATLQRSTYALSQYRDRLLKKGILIAGDHGHLRFALPGMQDFVIRQPAGRTDALLRPSRRRPQARSETLASPPPAPSDQQRRGHGQQRH